jgi:endonuclease YncB( thermonuclease family)
MTSELAVVKGSDVPMFMLPKTKYLARVCECYDGDTVTVILHEFGTYYKFKCRISKIDTAEIRISKNNERRDELKKLAFDARNMLAGLITNCEKCTEPLAKKEFQKLIDKNTQVLEMHVYGFDLYGRLLVDFDINGKFVSQIMIDSGLAHFYGGQHKESF